MPRKFVVLLAEVENPDNPYTGDVNRAELRSGDSVVILGDTPQTEVDDQDLLTAWTNTKEAWNEATGRP